MAEKVKLPEVVILGRSVQFKQFNDTQLVLIHRMRQMLSGALGQLPEADDDEDREMSDPEKQAMNSLLDVTGRFLDMIGFMVVNDGDREWLTMQMLGGNLDLDEISKFVPSLLGETKKGKTAAKKAVRAR
jgi:hypothetical protein